ncbi:hypothetical protein BC829DRAFT_105127 [Chytridium lagenaria]|nr:hypothetical protein BC829DRAFT_105127 [Chytridium lagenaria]
MKVQCIASLMLALNAARVAALPLSEYKYATPIYYPPSPTSAPIVTTPSPTVLGENVERTDTSTAKGYYLPTPDYHDAPGVRCAVFIHPKCNPQSYCVRVEVSASTGIETTTTLKAYAAPAPTSSTAPIATPIPTVLGVEVSASTTATVAKYYPPSPPVTTTTIAPEVTASPTVLGVEVSASTTSTIAKYYAAPPSLTTTVEAELSATVLGVEQTSTTPCPHKPTPLHSSTLGLHLHPPLPTPSPALPHWERLFSGLRLRPPLRRRPRRLRSQQLSLMLSQLLRKPQRLRARKPPCKKKRLFLRPPSFRRPPLPLPLPLSVFEETTSVAEETAIPTSIAEETTTLIVRRPLLLLPTLKKPPHLLPSLRRLHPSRKRTLRDLLISC